MIEFFQYAEITFSPAAVVFVGVLGVLRPNGLRLEIHDPLGADDPVPTCNRENNKRFYKTLYPKEVNNITREAFTMAQVTTVIR